MKHLNVRKLWAALCLALALCLAAPAVLPAATLSVATVAEAATTAKTVNLAKKKKATAYVGQKLQLTVKGASGKIKWSTSDKKVAKVSKKGVVTARKAGKAVITAAVAGKEYTCKVTVKTGLVVKKSNLNIKLKVGKTKQITVTNKVKGDVKITNSKSSVASAAWKKDWKGTKNKLTIKALSAGKTTIKLKNPGKETVKITVTVEGPAVTPVPTVEPTPEPTTEPEEDPYEEPEVEITAVPTEVPTPVPTAIPTAEPTPSEPTVTITGIDLPVTIAEYYGTGNKKGQVTLTDFQYTTKYYSYNNHVTAYLYFAGTLTYLKSSALNSLVKVNYNLYDSSGRLVKTGHFYTPKSLYQGQPWGIGEECKLTLFDLNPNETYTVTITNAMALDPAFATPTATPEPTEEPYVDPYEDPYEEPDPTEEPYEEPVPQEKITRELRTVMGRTISEVNSALPDQLMDRGNSLYMNQYYGVYVNGSGRINTVILQANGLYGMVTYTLFGCYPTLDLYTAEKLLTNYNWYLVNRSASSSGGTDYIYFNRTDSSHGLMLNVSGGEVRSVVYGPR